MKRWSAYITMIALLVVACQPDNAVSAFSSDTILQQVFHKEQWSRMQSTRSITGAWTYSFPFYSSMLSIRENGRFTYVNRDCLGSSYSAGSWRQDGRYYILCSDARFREPKKVETVPVEVTGSPGSLTFTCTTLAPDTSYIYFDNSRYLLEGDTLFGFNSENGEISCRYTSPVE